MILESLHWTKVEPLPLNLFLERVFSALEDSGRDIRRAQRRALGVLVGLGLGLGLGRRSRFVYQFGQWYSPCHMLSGETREAHDASIC